MHGALGSGKGASTIVRERGSLAGAAGSRLCLVFNILSAQRPRLSSASVPESEPVPLEQCGDLRKNSVIILA